jgi:hypothetical protein
MSRDVIAQLETAYAAIASVVTRVVFHQPVEPGDIGTVRELLEDVLPAHQVAVELHAPWLIGITVVSPNSITIYSRNLFATEKP